MAWLDDGARVAPLHQPGVRVQDEMRLGLRGIARVALVAVLDEDRANLLLEEVDALFRGARLRGFGRDLWRGRLGSFGLGLGGGRAGDGDQHERDKGASGE